MSRKHKKHEQPKAIIAPPPGRERLVFKLLPSETVMSDDAMVYPMYVYIVDGVFRRCYEMDGISVGDWKRIAGIKEVRRCDLFSHYGARLGDSVTP